MYAARAQFNPRIHIFAHLHSDGAKWIYNEKTLFTNVCHLSRKTREGISGARAVDFEEHLRARLMPRGTSLAESTIESSAREV